MKVNPAGFDPAFIAGFDTLYIDGRPRAVASSRVHKGMLIVRFADVEDVNDAMTLKNKTVYFAREDAKLPKGRFFLADLIGADVIDEAGRPVGKLTEVLDLPAGAVYVVQGEVEHTIPAVPEFILETNIEEHFLRVHLIEGM